MQGRKPAAQPETIAYPLADEPAYPLGAPERAVWDAIVPQLKALGLVQQVDGRLLCDYCTETVELARVRARIEADGLMIDGPHGLVRHPLLGHQSKLVEHLNRYRVELGLTPLSRQRLPVVKAPGERQELAAIVAAGRVAAQPEPTSDLPPPAPRKRGRPRKAVPNDGYGLPSA